MQLHNWATRVQNFTTGLKGCFTSNVEDSTQSATPLIQKRLIEAEQSQDTYILEDDTAGKIMFPLTPSRSRSTNEIMWAKPRMAYPTVDSNLKEASFNDGLVVKNYGSDLNEFSPAVEETRADNSKPKSVIEFPQLKDELQGSHRYLSLALWLVPNFVLYVSPIKSERSAVISFLNELNKAVKKPGKTYSDIRGLHVMHRQLIDLIQQCPYNSRAGQVYGVRFANADMDISSLLFG